MRMIVNSVVAVSLACIALGIQLLLIPVVAVDSYQLFLGAIVASAIYGGYANGILTLLICVTGKLYFVMPADILAVDSEFLLRTTLFLTLATLMCWVGGRFHASEQGLNAVLSNIADAVIATDQIGRIRFMNPAAEALIGLKQKAAVKQFFSEVVQLRDSLTGVLISIPRPIGPLRNNTVLDLKVGYALAVDGAISIIPGTAAAAGAVIVLRDVSERKRAEEERERLWSEVQAATAKVKVLSGLLPICAGCKKIRDKDGLWSQLESYVQAHSEAQFSHGLCPDCVEHFYLHFSSEQNVSESGRRSTSE